MQIMKCVQVTVITFPWPPYHRDASKQPLAELLESVLLLWYKYWCLLSCLLPGCETLITGTVETVRMEQLWEQQLCCKDESTLAGQMMWTLV